MSFIHWGVFEIPGVNLDEVTIPIREFPSDSLPDKSDVKALTEEFRTGLRELTGIPTEIVEAIDAQVAGLAVDPQAIEAYLEGPESLQLSNDGHGTHFYIQPADPTLEDQIEGDEEVNIAPPLIRTLIGFTNTMTSGQ